MSVKRYTHHWSSYKPSFMGEQSDGDYVSHSDYATLLASHNALRYNTKVIIKAYRKNRTRYNALKEVTEGLRDALRLINSGDHEDNPHSVAGYTLHLWEKELAALVGEE